MAQTFTVVCIFKIMNEKAPNYLINLIHKYKPNIRIRNNSIPSYKFPSNYFKHSFFPSSLNDQFNLHINLRNSELISSFRYRPLFLIRPGQDSIDNIFDRKGLNSSRLSLIHVNGHRFRYNFQEFLHSLCFCILICVTLPSALPSVFKPSP